MPGEVEPSEGAGTSNWRSDLRRALEQHFGEEDIEVLCFDLNVPYDNLSGTNLPLKIVSLITYLAQRGRIAELIDACSKQRENVDWEALKRAALADPSAGEIAPGTDEDEPSARDEERQQTDATEATAAPDERQAGRLVRAAVVTLPRWAVYLAIAIVVGLAGLLLARFVFFPSPAPSGGGETPTGPVVADVTEPASNTVMPAPTASPTPTPTASPTASPADSAPATVTPAPAESSSPTPAVSPTPTPTANSAPITVESPTPIPTLASGAVMERPMDGMRMRYVPAGSFQMGSEDGASDELPVHPVTLSAFWIDETEVSWAQYRLCAAAGFCDEVVLNPNVVGKLAEPNYPAIRVDYDNAQRYCQWVGGDLPTEAEWEYAARGSDGRPYPWGQEEPGCDLARFEACGQKTAPVDAFPGSSSWVGALNMAGNVYEWCRDWYGWDYYQDEASRQPDPTGPEQGEKRVLRGGSWLVEATFLRAADRYRADPAFIGDTVGFRCVVPAEDDGG